MLLRTAQEHGTGRQVHLCKIAMTAGREGPSRPAGRPKAQRPTRPNEGTAADEAVTAGGANEGAQAGEGAAAGGEAAARGREISEIGEAWQRRENARQGEVSRHSPGRPTEREGARGALEGAKDSRPGHAA